MDEGHRAASAPERGRKQGANQLVLRWAGGSQQVHGLAVHLVTMRIYPRDVLMLGLASSTEFISVYSTGGSIHLTHHAWMPRDTRLSRHRICHVDLVVNGECDARRLARRDYAGLHYVLAA